MISPGVVHAIPRTVEIARHIRDVHYIDTVGRGDVAPLESKGIACHCPAPGRQQFGARDIQRLLVKISPQAIICHYAAGDHFFAALSYGRCNVAAIAMGNDVLYDEGDRKVPMVERLVTRVALRHASFIAAKSRRIAGRLRQFNVRCPISINYWGGDLTRFSPGSPGDARRSLGLDPGATIILSPRAVEPRLNIHVIVEAFLKVREQHHTAQLVIIGRSNDEYRSQIEQLLDRAGLLACTHIRGEVSQEALPAYYRAADVIISLGGSEGFPNTVLEAMGCKAPVVVGRIPEIGELLEQGRNAWICDIEAGAVADAINEILGDPVQRERVVAGAYRTAHAQADIRTNGENFSRDFAHAVTGRAPRAIPTLIFRLAYLFFRTHRRFFQNR